MSVVKFKEVNPNDPNEFTFIDNGGDEYYLYSDKRGSEVKGTSPDFWDKFYFCESINVNFKIDEGVRKIIRIIRYK